MILPTHILTHQIKKLPWPAAAVRSAFYVLEVGFQGIHLNQPHLANFDPFQSARMQHPPQVLDVVTSEICGSLHSDMLMDEYACI